MEFIFVGGLGGCLGKTIVDTYFSEFFKFPIPSSGYNEAGDMPSNILQASRPNSNLTEGSNSNLTKGSNSNLTEGPGTNLSELSPADMALKNIQDINKISWENTNACSALLRKISDTNLMIKGPEQ